jgi:AraC-like DNA-binding protein
MNYKTRVLLYLRSADLSKVNAVRVADSFGISDRWLFTLLEREGARWMDILNRVREDRVLANPRASVSVQMVRTGFKSSKTFHVWFARQHGVAYGQYTRHAWLLAA